MGSGYDTDGKADDSHTRSPQFKIQSSAIIILNMFTNCIISRKDENKHKRGREWPILMIVCLSGGGGARWPNG